MKIDPANYLFKFESQGTSFLFEDIDTSYYTPEGSVITSQNAVVRTYVTKEADRIMQEFGEAQTPADLHAVVASIQAVRDTVLAETPAYAAQEVFTVDDAKHMFSQIASLFRDYFYFDFSKWDTVFQKAAQDPVMKEMVGLVEQYKNELRTYFDPIMFTDGGYFWVLLAHITKMSGVPREDLEWYREAELYALFDGRHVSAEEIEARKIAYVFSKDAEIELIAGEEAQVILRSLLGEPTDSQALVGKVAHAGGKDVVHGKVRLIVRDYGDPSVLRESMRQMTQGEILVSQSTDPELLDAMKKAAAIVTDVGGMLSHAAITARELNVPCVVGTGNASKVLKDGDEVEIDIRTGAITQIS